MISNLITYFNNFNHESFNMTINRFIVYLTLEKIYRDYSTDTMYCNREMVRKALIKRMQIEYLFKEKEFN